MGRFGDILELRSLLMSHSSAIMFTVIMYAIDNVPLIKAMCLLHKDILRLWGFGHCSNMDFRNKVLCIEQNQVGR